MCSGEIAENRGVRISSCLIEGLGSIIFTVGSREGWDDDLWLCDLVGRFGL